MATKVSVISALMDSLAEAREDAGKEYRHIRNYIQTSERMLRRYEGKENFPSGADIDDLVGAYAAALGKPSVFDLWDEAIRRARRATETDVDQARRAEEAARAAGEATRKAREQSSGSQRPRGSRRRAG